MRLADLVLVIHRLTPLICLWFQRGASVESYLCHLNRIVHYTWPPALKAAADHVWKAERPVPAVAGHSHVLIYLNNLAIL